eukprot:CAMPEP_0114597542 /NCGR_PEP_ID=MMETSP0125-20121206/19842_1 /TAXON_ID=485358 ORGANISM="Aristerostoma sp., Strain ATCC 50986" /NCGR_SAMPLE_ID=MMETSP0125 /ASSEMBLY_ACC=CAM_ASM_000245 /LENGTH=202 /DNA_ID=CAMNT_0001802237 /DNA_START=136 /DNA_END=741 /DNA_ORIENTATION=+
MPQNDNAPPNQEFPNWGYPKTEYPNRAAWRGLNIVRNVDKLLMTQKRRFFELCCGGTCYGGKTYNFNHVDENGRKKGRKILKAQDVVAGLHAAIARTLQEKLFINKDLLMSSKSSPLMYPTNAAHVVFLVFVTDLKCVSHILKLEMKLNWAMLRILADAVDAVILELILIMLKMRRSLRLMLQNVNVGIASLACLVSLARQW